MDKRLLYKIAYRNLMYLTPVKFDCGKLCNRSCCKGTEEKGMQLYPGEETYLAEAVSEYSIRDEYLEGEKIRFAVCSGNCRRQHRPLACRIYPLAPYLTEEGKLKIIEDPRASYHCPLIMPRSEISINKIFKRKAYEVFRLLTKDPDIYDYIFTLSRVIDEYSRFTGARTDITE